LFQSIVTSSLQRLPELISVSLCVCMCLNSFFAGLVFLIQLGELIVKPVRSCLSVCVLARLQWWSACHSLLCKQAMYIPAELHSPVAAGLLSSLVQ